MKAKNIFLVLFSICTVIITVTLVAIGKDYFRPAEGYILDERFVSAYTAQYTYSYGRLVFAAFALAFAGSGLIYSLFWNRITKTGGLWGGYIPNDALEIRKSVIAVYWAICIIVFYIPCAIEVCHHITSNPYAEEVTLEQKYIRKEAKGSGNNERFYFYFAFSNGTHTEVPKDTYDQYSEEHEFCIIIYDDRCIGYFDADQYTLEDTTK